jgi:DNA processing protein
MYEEKIYQVALSMVPGIGDINAKTLISYCRNARDIFHCATGKLSDIPGIGLKTARAIKQFRNFDEAEREVARCRKSGVNILFYTDKKYPKKLKQAPDGPIILYAKGNVDLNQSKVVAIVGTRRSTAYGREFVDRLVAGLVDHRPLIVSGLAYGIDIQAHRAALKNGLPTVGVMASGLDIIYPASHKSTAGEMLENGGLISENRLGVLPEAHLFPARNRIIAGMADAVIVVEAARRGGALITAEIANSYNRDVFAVPGNLDRNYSVGCNNLIKNHKAHLLTGIQDLEYIMNWEKGKKNAATTINDIDWDALNDEEAGIVRVLLDQQKALLVDELSWRTQIPVNKLAVNLLNLELLGIVRSLQGNKYKLS